MWVRGLKPSQLRADFAKTMSHPMWVRGLKPCGSCALCQEKKVAPHVGAWIETELWKVYRRQIMSHPMWVRGLKLILLCFRPLRLRRTPCGCVD